MGYNYSEDDADFGRFGGRPKEMYGEILSQLEQLIGLAENSAKSIDELQEALSRLRIRVFYVVSFIYILALGSAIFFVYLVDAVKGGYSIIWQFGLVTTVLLVAMVFTKLMIELRRSKDRTQRELMVESHTQQELISLIDGQLRRLSIDDEYFPMDAAILNIRVRRLERQIDGKLQLNSTRD